MSEASKVNAARHRIADLETALAAANKEVEQLQSQIYIYEKSRSVHGFGCASGIGADCDCIASLGDKPDAPGS
jgi:hypothetical protein